MRNTIDTTIPMVDLASQHLKIKEEIESCLQRVLSTSHFINGPEVREFENELGNYLGGAYVTGCGNGTDALQIALMALGLKPGDEVLVPSFTFVSCAEVIALLNLKPVWLDVHPDDFNIDPSLIEAKITSKTRAVIVVHLFGQCADMEYLGVLAKKHKLFVIEDVAQSLGAECILSSGKRERAGTIGHIGCTSFFPSKILGCMGDGGAIITKDEHLSARIRMIANHGGKKKYTHDLVGVNSRLDTIQAAVLRVKLNYINDYIEARRTVAALYTSLLTGLAFVKLPVSKPNSTHVYNQYTIQLLDKLTRDELKVFLQENGISTMIYYPVPLHLQPAYHNFSDTSETLPVSESLSERVLSLPIHTEMERSTVTYISSAIKSFFESR